MNARFVAQEVNHVYALACSFAHYVFALALSKFMMLM